MLGRGVAKNVLGTAAYNVSVMINLGLLTRLMTPDSFSAYVVVTAAGGMAAVICGFGIPAWTQLNTSSAIANKKIAEGLGRVPLALSVFQMLFILVIGLTYLVGIHSEDGKGLLQIYFLQLSMVISQLADSIAIGMRKLNFLNFRRILPEVPFSFLLITLLMNNAGIELVTNFYVACWIFSAIVSSYFIVKHLKMTFGLDFHLFMLIRESSAYFQWAVAQTLLQRGSQLFAGSYCNYEAVMILRWSQTVSNAVSHAYNALAQVVFPHFKFETPNKKISIFDGLTRLNLGERKLAAAGAILAFLITIVFVVCVSVTSGQSPSLFISFVFYFYAFSVIIFYNLSTQANWNGDRFWYLLSQYLVLIGASFALTIYVLQNTGGVQETSAAQILSAIGFGKFLGIGLLKRKFGLRKVDR
jgi:hypothetical protein